MESNASRLSVVIVTKNEERNLRDCLDSARWADEIVVVDSYSTDRTLEIAREFTDRIYERPWEGFGIQKNHAMDMATSPWVFILDADERITEQLRDEIRSVVASPPAGIVGYQLPRRNFFYGVWIQHCGCYPDYQLRLLRKGLGRLDDAEPHNKMILQGEMGTLSAPLDHLTSPTVGDHLKKMSNFSKLAAQEKYKTKKKVGGRDLFFPPIAMFIKMYLLRGGWREGIAGFVFAGFASLYTFLKYAKLWEMIYGEKR
ncbi:MAG TPA: glycosyltransferase family 2 protein [Nitrospiria bacterium]|nr:glycosyltransferase family 2 protein [Nitrospiria bacterium]